ncbi:MAG TPA: VTT domain-containing protein [Azospirillaceae bacterium]|nr:VTT domain-containing protein [Azospirillaceae bacterium]
MSLASSRNRTGRRPEGPEPGTAQERPLWVRLLPFGLIVAAAVTAYALGLHRHLDLESLARHRQALQAFTQANPVLAPAAFIAAYVTVAALGLPVGVFASLTGGFLFGMLAGAAYAVVGAAIGAMLLFLAARTALRDTLARWAGPRVRKFEDGFRKDAFSYMLVLRLLPILPFWLVNLIPALLGVPLRTYVVATFLGIIPGALVYASVGNGLGAVLDAGRKPDLGLILQPSVLLPLLGLAALSLLPVAYRYWKGDRH